MRRTIFSEEHDLFRSEFRRFAESELLPHNEAWLEAGGDVFRFQPIPDTWTLPGGYPEGTFRGGFYVDTMINGPGCLYATTAHNVYHWDYSTGFRCCAD